MEKYSKVSMMECGSSEEVIKGACGWGTENITLDKTGATWTTRRKQVLIGWLPGYTQVYQCKYAKACSSESHTCKL